MTSAMPLMPMPPMPTKCTGPMSRGSFIGAPSSRRPNLMVCARPRHLQDQVGQPVGGIEPAHRFGGGCHGSEPGRGANERRELGGEPAWGKDVLGQADG